MTVEWTYDNPNGDEIEIDPMDYEGMTEAQIESAIYNECVRRAKAQATCYVSGLDDAVREIRESIEKGGE